MKSLRESILSVTPQSLDKDRRKYEKENPSVKYKAEDFFKQWEDSEDIDPQILRIAKQIFGNFLKYGYNRTTVPFRNCYMHVLKESKTHNFGGREYKVVFSESSDWPEQSNWDMMSGRHETFFMEGYDLRQSIVQMTKIVLMQLGRSPITIVEK